MPTGDVPVQCVPGNSAARPEVSIESDRSSQKEHPALSQERGVIQVGNLLKTRGQG